MARTYYRCRNCLGLAVINGEPLAVAAHCQVCERPMELLGKVRKCRSRNQAREPECNGLCTTAQGPNCTCKCGGQNHGAQLLSRTLARKNGYRVLSMNEPERCLRQAREFEQALEKIKAAMDNAKQARRGPAAFNGACAVDRYKQAIANAKTLRSHESRMKLLFTALEDCSVKCTYALEE